MAAGDVLRSIDGPRFAARGLAWGGGRSMWHVEATGREVYQLDTLDGSTIRSWDPSVISPTGIAFDGRSVWVHDASDDIISRHDPVTGEELETISTPAGSVGLSSDGRSLWYILVNKTDVVQVSRTGTVLRTLSPTATQLSDLTFDGRWLWLLDIADDIVRQVDPLTGVQQSGFDIPGPFLSQGIAWDGQGLWVAKEGIFGVLAATIRKHALT